MADFTAPHALNTNVVSAAWNDYAALLAHRGRGKDTNKTALRSDSGPEIQSNTPTPILLYGGHFCL